MRAARILAQCCRDRRRASLVEESARDVMHAVRSLLRAPAFTAAAVLTVALGIGVNTAAFGVIHPVLLDPLPYRDPDRLVHLSSTHPAVPSHQSAAPDVADWQRMSKSFESICAFTFRAVNKWTILGDGEPEVVQVVQASTGLFDTLGIQPVLGRWYTDEEDRTRKPVVVIGESLWRRKYGADPKILGRTIRLVGWPVTVIGVAGQRTAQPAWADVWMPLAFLDPALTGSRRHRALEVIARLKPGVTIEQAQREMAGIAANLEREYPATNGRTSVEVMPLTSWMTGEVRPALLIAWIAAGLVLLLACANVAHLVLVRTVHRSRELAVRSALGAGSARLTRLLLVENVVVAAAGGVLGAILARIALTAISKVGSIEIPRFDSAALSPATMIFGAVAAGACALLFALPAVLHARGLSVLALMKQGGVSLGHRRSWLGPAIIAVEVALAFLVISGAGLLYRSFDALTHEKTGFDTRGILVADTGLGPIDWKAAAEHYSRRVAPRLHAIPGVTMIGAVNLTPMTLRPSEATRFATRFGIAGRHFESGQYPVAQIRWITHDYFPVMRIPILSGRGFEERDAGKPGYIVNETLARRFFPNSNPVGENILMNVMAPKPEVIPIVGVVADARDMSFDAEPVPTLYAAAMSNRAAIMLRTEGDPAALAPAVRSALREVNPDTPIHLLAPLAEVLRDSLALRRFSLGLIGGFAVLAIALTAVGVYGIVNYSLSQRTSEFAIRFALGARASQVHALVFGKLAVPAGIGLALGALLTAASPALLRMQLYEVSPHDPVVLVASAVGLLALVLGSALRPTAKAAKVSPASILRDA